MPQDQGIALPTFASLRLCAFALNSSNVIEGVFAPFFRLGERKIRRSGIPNLSVIVVKLLKSIMIAPQLKACWVECRIGIS